jgi:hypothetical protein
LYRIKRTVQLPKSAASAIKISKNVSMIISAVVLEDNESWRVEFQAGRWDIVDNIS